MLHRTFRMSELLTAGRGLACAALAAATAPVAVAGDCTPQWSGGAGMNEAGGVASLVVFDDGAGPALYAGGSLTAGVARFDGATWTPLPNGPVFEVRALAVFDEGDGPKLFSAPEAGFGGGAPLHGVGRWNGVDWESVGGGVDRLVLAMQVFDDGMGGGPALYAGGTFTLAGGAPAPGIARWDGAAWAALGNLDSAIVQAITVFDDGGGPALYIGGQSISFNGLTTNIAKWDGAAWTPVGVGFTGAIRALTAFDDGAGPALFAGGSLVAQGTVFPLVIGRWDGAAWTSAGSGFNGTTNALRVFNDGAGDALYAGGDFSAGVTKGGDAPISRIARWDGALWSALGAGTDSSVASLVATTEGQQPALFVGGQFNIAGGAASRGVARWTGCAVSGPSADLNGDGTVNAADLALLLGMWGTMNASGDLDGNGVVGSGDLARLLGAWGP